MFGKLMQVLVMGAAHDKIADIICSANHDPRATG
jgi:hypothetical protein